MEYDIEKSIIVGYPRVRKFQMVMPMKNPRVCAHLLNQ
jgi:hypothetical protein